MLENLICGRYQIIEQLGAGAMGTTFIAIDRQRPGNPRCVVKKFTPIYKNPKSLKVARRLFAQEAQILEKLGNHDQIPRLLAYCEEKGEFYLVQELIEGQDLSEELIPDKRLSESEVIKLLKDILGVLVFVQQHGVIHRDIKPSNLIRRASDGKIVLIDFGAVKQINTQVINSQGKIESPTIIGTPGYMPREQYNGNPGFYSDVYAVGMIGIQALTGLFPNLLPTDEKNEIVWRNRTQVSSQLADIIDLMVQSRAAHRYQSALTALEALNIIDEQEVLSSKQNLIKSEKTKISNSKSSNFFKIGIGFLGINIAAILILYLIYGIVKQINNNFLNYQNSEYKIKINYPKQWSIREEKDAITGDMIIFSSPQESQNDFQDNVNITIENLPNPMSLAEYTNDSLEQIRKFSDVKVSEPNEAILSNSRAMAVTFMPQANQGHELKIMQIWTVRNNQAYTITYTAEESQFNRYLKQAEPMVESFKIEE